jgi:cytochrome c
VRPVIVVTLWIISVTCFAFDRYTGHGGPIKGLAYSASQRLVVSTSFDYTAVVWATNPIRELKRLVAHDAAVNAATFSPDGNWLATAGDDNQIFLWRVDDLKKPDIAPLPIPLDGHTAKIIHLAFSSDSTQLASSSWDRRIGIWDVQKGTRIRFLKGHRGLVNASVFSPDAQNLYSAGADGHIRYWDLSNGEYVRSVVKNGFGINVLAIDHELNVLAYGGSNGVMKSVSLDGKGPAIELWIGGPPVLALSIDRQSEKMAFGTAEGRIVIADAVVGEIEHDFQAVNGPVWALQLTENSENLLFAGLDDWITRIPLENLIVPSVLPGGSRRFHSGEPADNGAQQFARKCSVCHSLAPLSKRRAGPTLYGVFGRKVGKVENYPYSPELLAQDLVWNEDTIDRLFREGPDIVTPGSKMPVQRIKRQEDRDDLIRYLKRATTTQ